MHTPPPLLAILLGLTCAPLAFGGEVELRDTKTGKVVATFNPATTKIIEIEGRKYAVKPLMTVAEMKARKTIVPKVEFKDATLEEAIRFLDRRHGEEEDIKKPFNLVLVAQNFGEKRLSLSMRDATYYSLLRTIAEMTGCEVTYDDERVALVEARKP